MTEYEELDAQLRKWLAEDAQLARCAANTSSGKPGGHWKTACTCEGECREYGDCERVVGDNITIYNEGGHDADQAKHIARHDPAAVLADIAGQLAILDRVIPAMRAAERMIEGEWGSGVADLAGHENSELLLLSLAAGYVDRPEFKPDWKLT